MTMNRTMGGMWGLLIGDALGVPHEFKSPMEIPREIEIEMDLPEGYARSHSRVPIGTWSDDGAQALALWDTLMVCKRLDLDAFAARLLDWYEEGRFTPDGVVFDVGNQTHRALRRLKDGVDPRMSGRAVPGKDLGNGSLMRTLPVALYWSAQPSGTVRDVIRDGYVQSVPTHDAELCRVACSVYCAWAYFELKQSGGFAEAVSETSRHLTSPEARNALTTLQFHEARPGGGMVLDTLLSARRNIEGTRNYAGAVRAAIIQGGDTDTHAAVVGGIAGIRYGLEGIPRRWRNAIRGKDILIGLGVKEAE